MTCKECGYYKKDDSLHPCYPTSPDGKCIFIEKFGGLCEYCYVSSNDDSCNDFVKKNGSHCEVRERA